MVYSLIKRDDTYNTLCNRHRKIRHIFSVHFPIFKFEDVSYEFVSQHFTQQFGRFSFYNASRSGFFHTNSVKHTFKHLRLPFSWVSTSLSPFFWRGNQIVSAIPILLLPPPPPPLVVVVLLHLYHHQHLLLLPLYCNRPYNKLSAALTTLNCVTPSGDFLSTEKRQGLHFLSVLYIIYLLQ